jgi:AcrR family transcriptional regulator
VSITGDGRQRLLDTALRLFDEQGIGRVSARAIAIEAGHRNVGAVNYHFGNLGELVRAALNARIAEIDLKRTAILDLLEATGPVEPRAALRAVVSPITDLLDDTVGRRHLRVVAQAMNHPAFSAAVNLSFSRSAARAVSHVAFLVRDLSPERQAYRIQNSVGFALNAIADHSRQLDTDAPQRTPLDKATFIDELLDNLLAILEGPSPRTV